MDLCYDVGNPILNFYLKIEFQQTKVLACFLWKIAKFNYVEEFAGKKKFKIQNVNVTKQKAKKDQ